MIAVVVAATAASCKRHEDPYADWKAPQLLDEGDRLVRLGDLAGADAVYQRGKEVAKKNSLKVNDPRVFDQRRMFIAAAREDVPVALDLYGVVGGGNDYMTMDVRMGVDLVVLLARAGRMDDARKLAERLAQRLQSTAPANHEEIPLYIVGWMAIDYLRTANVELERAREASTAVVDALSSGVEKAVVIHQPLNPAVRQWTVRYVDHLYDTERTLVAQKVADLVERIDEVAPPDPEAKPCLPLEPLFPAFGCIPEWPVVPAKAGT